MAIDINHQSTNFEVFKMGKLSDRLEEEAYLTLGCVSDLRNIWA